MANYNNLKTAIQDVIKANGNQEITGEIMQNALLSMINSLGAGYQFVSVATPETNPGTPDQKVFYIANGKGTYVNFGGLVVDEDEVVLLVYDDAWKKFVTQKCCQPDDEAAAPHKEIGCAPHNACASLLTRDNCQIADE